MNSHLRLGVSPTAAPPLQSSQLCISVSHSVTPACTVCHLEAASPAHMVHSLAPGSLSQPRPHGLLPCLRSSRPTCLTSLAGLVDSFFNSLVVRVPCSLIFWHFRLFIDFRFVVILLFIVQGSKGFLPTPACWPQLIRLFFSKSSFDYLG